MTTTDSSASTNGTLTAAEIRAAVGNANIPPLLMTVYQFTGDRTWLDERYRPKRIRGLNPRTDGGLSEQAQNEVREAAVPVIAALQAGEQPAITDVDGEEMAELVSFFLGEDVDPRYGPMLGSEIERRSHAQRSAPAAKPVAVPDGLQVAVIGLGLQAWGP